MSSPAADETVDYLIIGAGLAGLTMHHFLESDSKVIVDSRPARYKLGESLIPEHFSDSGLASLLAKARALPSYSPKCGSMFIGSDSVAAFPLSPEDYSRALHVRREELERLMIDEWQVPIRDERVTGLDVAARVVTTSRRTYRVRRQILDCSGPAMVVARSLGRSTELWKSWASWMYYDIVGIHEARFTDWLRDAGVRYARYDPGLGHPLGAPEYPGWRSFDCTVVAQVQPGSFAWQIPLYGRSILSFGVTSRLGPVSLDALREAGRRCIAPHYEVRERPHDRSSEYNRFHVGNRFSHRALDVATRDWILVGDAGFFGEPIYATGTSVAVNQALYVARALNRGGWGEAELADYVERCGRVVAASTEARRYFFAPADDQPAEPREVFRERGIDGTPFQLTMANNYGRVLLGLLPLSESADQGRSFGSVFESDAGEQEALTVAFARWLGAVPSWSVRAVYRAKAGLQVAFTHTTKPELTVRLASLSPGDRAYRVVGPFGLTYRSARNGDYPLDPSTDALFAALSRRLTTMAEPVSGWLSGALVPPESPPFDAPPEP